MIKVGDIVKSFDTLGHFEAEVMAYNAESGIAYAVRRMNDKFRGYNFHAVNGKHANAKSTKVFQKVSK